MTHPTKHPKTGTYLLRVAIPEPLRATTKQLFGVCRELRENLGTKSAAEARKRAPAALARLQAKLARAQAAAEARTHAHSCECTAAGTPSQREIAALSGALYRNLTGADLADQAQYEAHWEEEIAMVNMPGGSNFTDEDLIDLAPGAAELELKKNGFAVTPATLRATIPAIHRALTGFRDLVQRRSAGD